MPRMMRKSRKVGSAARSDGEGARSLTKSLVSVSDTRTFRSVLTGQTLRRSRKRTTKAWTATRE